MFSGHCQADSIRLTLEVMDVGDHPELAGYDVCRRAMGTCESPTRITDVPWRREPGQFFVRRFTDGDIAAGRLYEYEVVGVDAGRNRSGTSLRPVVSGLDLPGLRELRRGGDRPGILEPTGWWPYVRSCAAACLGDKFLETYPPELDALVGTGTEVLLFGFVGCGTVEGCLAHVVSCVVQPCAVAVERSTWGLLKSRYRGTAR